MFLFWVGEPLELTVRYVPGEMRIQHQVREVSVDDTLRSSPSQPVSAFATRLRAPAGTRASREEIYFGTSPGLAEALDGYRNLRLEAGRPLAMEIITGEARDHLVSRPAMPLRLGYVPGGGEPFTALGEQLTPLGGLRRLRVAIINVFHHRFGDTILSLTLLRELRSALDSRFAAVEIDLLQGVASPDTERLYRRSGLVQAIHLLPLPLSFLAGYDAYLDFSTTHLRSDVHWLDDYLQRIGVDPETVPPSRKRSWLPREMNAAGRLGSYMASHQNPGSPVMLFHPQASTRSRSLPESVASHFVGSVLERTNWLVASAVPVRVHHPRFLDWSGLSRSLDDLVYLVSSSQMFVSVDTCVYHIADAFDIPGVVLFTTVQPELRTAYYPYVEGIELHSSNHTSDGWHPELDVEQVLAALDRAVHRRRTKGHLPGNTHEPNAPLQLGCGS